MSVIWSGITEQGAVVPVQVDETGKVIATASIPDEYVLKSGDTMSGPLVLPGDPQTAKEAATKQYVDSALAPNTPLAYGYYTFSEVFVGAFNISSCRKLGVGSYQLYFRQPPPSSNYCLVCTSVKEDMVAYWRVKDVFSFTIDLRQVSTGYTPTNQGFNFIAYWAPDEVKMSMS